jgi:hypothetical protein
MEGFSMSRHNVTSLVPMLLLLAVPGALAALDDPDLAPGASDRIDKADYLRLRAEHVATLRGLRGPVPAYARTQAIRSLERQERTSSRLDPRIGSLQWTPIGPAPIPNGQTNVISVPVSGRVTAIAVHPTDPNKVYVGTANGGTYRSLDGGATWTPITDKALSLAVGALAIDPITPTRLWIGTGEGNSRLDSYFGVGLYRISDAESPSPVLEGPFTLDEDGQDVFSYASVTKILIHPSDPNTLFVATTDGFFPNGRYGSPPPLGLYRSQTALGKDPRFRRLAVPPGANSTPIGDAIFEPGNPGHLLCTVVSSDASFGGVWRTTNAGASRPSFAQTLPLPLIKRGMLAADHVGVTVSVLLTTGEPANSIRCRAGESGALRRSMDGGLTWSAPLAAAAGFCDGNCDYDSPVALDPRDSSLIYLGGPADTRTGCSLTFTRSTDGGRTFSAKGTSDRGLHADTHAIAIAPSDPTIVYLGNDGGIFKSTDRGQSWTSLNNSQFSATQFYSLALHPLDRQLMIGGTQDNGTVMRQADAAWIRAVSGDGGFTAIDSSATDSMTFDLYGTYNNNVNRVVNGVEKAGSIGLVRAASAACAAKLDEWAFRGCGRMLDENHDCDGEAFIATNGLSCDDSAVLPFPPLVQGPGHPVTLYFGTDRLYRSSDRGETMKVVSQQFEKAVAVSAIGIAPGDDRIRLVGLENGRLFLTLSGSSALAEVTGAIPNRFVARIVIDPADPAVAYVTLDAYAGQQVWKTTDLTSGHPTWQAAGKGMPNIPVNAFVIDPGNSQHLFAGTDIGVFYSPNGGAQWVPLSNGLPRVPVFDIGFQGTQRVLRIATHGRGIWEITPPAAGLR